MKYVLPLFLLLAAACGADVVPCPAPDLSVPDLSEPAKPCPDLAAPADLARPLDPPADLAVPVCDHPCSHHCQHPGGGDCGHLGCHTKH
jgi:hypothetical protein